MTQSDTKSQESRDDAPALRVIPLGGLGTIGKNILALEAANDIIIIDAGLMFPTSEMHGIDLVIPDTEYLLDRVEQVRAILLTHGHEDHIGVELSHRGGLRAPVYGTSLTLGLLPGN
ncbi:MAG: MBL fold metallo-hydrolase [Caldilineaceae bacterium]